MWGWGGGWGGGPYRSPVTRNMTDLENWYDHCATARVDDFPLSENFTPNPEPCDSVNEEPAVVPTTSCSCACGSGATATTDEHVPVSVSASAKAEAATNTNANANASENATATTNTSVDGSENATATVNVHANANGEGASCCVSVSGSEKEAQTGGTVINPAAEPVVEPVKSEDTQMASQTNEAEGSSVAEPLLNSEQTPKPSVNAQEPQLDVAQPPPPPPPMTLAPPPPPPGQKKPWLKQQRREPFKMFRIPSSYDEDDVSDEELLLGGPYTPDSTLSKKIALYAGSVTTLRGDAIVNAANGSLLGGGGVDGAIHAAAGFQLLEECEKLNGCDTGQTKITKGYRLPAKYVLHTVGPVGENCELLDSCYKTCLSFVDSHNIRTLAFCGISTGIFGFPLKKAANIALHRVRRWLETGNNREKVDRIIFANYTDREVRVYDLYTPYYFPPVVEPNAVNSSTEAETKGEASTQTETQSNADNSTSKPDTDMKVETTETKHEASVMNPETEEKPTTETKSTTSEPATTAPIDTKETEPPQSQEMASAPTDDPSANTESTQHTEEPHTEPVSTPTTQQEKEKE
ncbi:ADP-ribose glycohydrolase MACROD2 [Pelomyxa schiedti]|nr:ADP-ribose glycohydrolase MACROD2 [Pelomyxa schiedti]